jgi:hypothetical protein
MTQPPLNRRRQMPKSELFDLRLTGDAPMFELPPSRQRRTFPAVLIGFSLETDEETRRELERLREEDFKRMCERKTIAFR